MNAAQIIHALGGQPNMSGGMCRCPAHEDDNPSLSVTERDGKVLVHCHAGCSQETVLAALEQRGLYERTHRVNGSLEDYQHPKLGKPGRIWSYHDAHGRVVFATGRWDTAHGKEIRPLIPTAAGWKAGGTPEPRPLFNLPGILAAPDAPVLVCEGEKAAEAAAKQFPDHLATTPAHGAKSPHKTDWAPVKGRDVIVWPDADQAGHSFANHVARLARKANAASVRIVTLPDNLPRGWDLADEVPGDMDLDTLLAEAGESDKNTDADDSNFEQAVIRLAALPAYEYDHVRVAEAKCLRVRVSTLDGAVKAACLAANGDDLQGRAVEWPEPEPWPEPVDGAALLDEVLELILYYVRLPDGGAEAVALWALYSWVFESFGVSPYLMVTAPERETGKTRITDLLSWMVPRPKPVSDASAAAIIRGIEKDRPVLLFDEAQHFLKRRPDDPIRGMLLASFTRRFAFVERCEGDANEVRIFSTFAPKAMNGRKLANVDDMLTSRSIIISMTRAPSRMPDLRSDCDPVGDDIRRKCARWRDDHAAALRSAEPDMGERYGRSADVWRPLFAVAEAVGSDWPAKARRAASALDTSSLAIMDNDSLGMMLLADIREVFRSAGELDRITSNDLDNRLIDLPERPWAALGRTGKPLSSSRRGQILKPYGIKSQPIWIDGQSERGYLRSQFSEAWNAYLPQDPANKGVRCKESSNHAGFSDSKGVRRENAPYTFDPPETQVNSHSLHLTPLLPGATGKNTSDDLEERAAIMEYDGKLARTDAEAAARQAVSDNQATK